MLTGKLCLLFRALFAALLLSAGIVEAQAPKHLTFRLVPETTRPRAGSTLTVALAATPEPGWHGYWKNGGDAGVETKLTWTGVTASPIRYPAPERLIVAGLMNYVYAKPYALLVDLTIPTGLAAGTKLPISVKADYLVCSATLCVPESATLSTDLTIGDGAVDPATAAQFDGWRRVLPRPLGGTAQFAVADGKLRLAIPYPASAPIGDAYFYPLTTGAIAYAAPQKVERRGDTLLVSTQSTGAPTSLDGVLATGSGPSLTIQAQPGDVPASAETGWPAAALAFLGAVLGGLLLNVMPCVFPILSLKALSLARSGESPTAARRDALAYTAGVVLVCAGLGAAILLLRAGGTSVGWAFQLQDPRVVFALLLLTAAITLNLLGTFELPTPAFAGRSGTAGAFATGALAAFVATPCSGPFMGAALGAALVLSPLAALLVFAGLGLGIALPFLAIGFVPALRSRLPKPGAWMRTFRRILAVPMALTAAALAWLLWRQTGEGGLILGLAAAILLAAALWWTGRRQHRGRSLAWGPALAALVVVAGSAAALPRAAAHAATSDEAFSETRLAALRASGRPVFAYFTADWCLTCKVNEKAAIETDTVRAAFRRKNVAVLVGDWTNGDPALGRFIEAHGRAGVPLYLYYPAGGGAPRELPQVLTPGQLAAL